MARQVYRNRPLIIGLTGSIGTGKSTAAKILNGFGIPVHDADKAVHAALSKGGASVKAVARLYPFALKGGAIDRWVLGKAVFASPEKIKQLEKILHPVVARSEQDFVRAAHRRRKKAVVLEIPLLFEIGADRWCDVTLCMTSSSAVQKKRVMKRPGMTQAKFRAILKQQLSNREKRQRADYVINSDKSLADVRRQLKKTWEKIKEEFLD